MPSQIHGFWAVVVLAAVVGCADAPPQHDPLVNYTPESLAAELSMRYGSLPPAARNGAAMARVRPRGPVEARKNEVTKEAPGESLASLLDEIAAKAGAIPGMDPAAARAAVADRVAADPTIAADHKAKIAEALRRPPAP